MSAPMKPGQGPGKVSPRARASTLTCDVDLATNKIHFKIISFILEAGIKLELEAVPTAAACVIYHRFFSRCRLADYDPHLIATSSLYLAAKVEEQHLRIRDVVNVAYRILHKNKAPLEIGNTFWELRDSVTNCELLILRVLKFNVSVELPHKYLLHYLKSLQSWLEPEVWENVPITRTAWALLRDSYHSPSCLKVKPQHLAVSVLYFALQCYGVNIPLNDIAETVWWKVFCDDINNEKIHQIIEELIDMYDIEVKV